MDTMPLDPERDHPTIEAAGVRHAFCSNDCRRRFLTSHDGALARK